MELYEKINLKLNTSYEDNSDINWREISSMKNLPWDFIIEYKDKIDWCLLSGNIDLSEHFIHKFRYYVDCIKII